MPNRTSLQTPAGKGQRSKVSKLVLLDLNSKNDVIEEGEKEGGTPDSAQRPSSTRRHSKLFNGSRRSNTFQTPLKNGKHWEVSEGDLVYTTQQETEVLEETVEDDDSEVEYCPPNTLSKCPLCPLHNLLTSVLDLPYQPPIDFDLPNYYEVGRTLREAAYSFPRIDVVPPPEHDIAPADLGVPSWNFFDLPPLGTFSNLFISSLLTQVTESEDPFEKIYLASAPSPQSPSKTDRKLTAASTSRPGASQRTTATTKPAPRLVTSRLAATNRTVPPRPATSASLYPPARSRTATLAKGPTIRPKSSLDTRPTPQSAGSTTTVRKPTAPSTALRATSRPTSSTSDSTQAQSTRPASKPASRSASGTSATKTQLRPATGQVATLKDAVDSLDGVEDFVFEV